MRRLTPLLFLVGCFEYGLEPHSTAAPEGPEPSFDPEVLGESGYWWEEPWTEPPSDWLDPLNEGAFDEGSSTSTNTWRPSKGDPVGATDAVGDQASSGNWTGAELKPDGDGDGAATGWYDEDKGPTMSGAGSHSSTNSLEWTPRGDVNVDDDGSADSDGSGGSTGVGGSSGTPSALGWYQDDPKGHGSLDGASSNPSKGDLYWQPSPPETDDGNGQAWQGFGKGQGLLDGIRGSGGDGDATGTGGSDGSGSSDGGAGTGGSTGSEDDSDSSGGSGWGGGDDEDSEGSGWGGSDDEDSEGSGWGGSEDDEDSEGSGGWGGSEDDDDSSGSGGNGWGHWGGCNGGGSGWGGWGGNSCDDPEESNEGSSGSDGSSGGSSSGGSNSGGSSSTDASEEGDESPSGWGAARMTGGGVAAGASHGFTVHCDYTHHANNIEVNWEGNSFHMEGMDWAYCVDDPDLDAGQPRSLFDTIVGQGWGRMRDGTPAQIWFVFTDDGEPGTSDWMTVEIDAGGDENLVFDGVLEHGNQQAHDPNRRRVSL